MHVWLFLSQTVIVIFLLCVDSSQPPPTEEGRVRPTPVDPADADNSVLGFLRKFQVPLIILLSAISLYFVNKYFLKPAQPWEVVAVYICVLDWLLMNQLIEPIFLTFTMVWLISTKKNFKYFFLMLKENGV